MLASYGNKKEELTTKVEVLQINIDTEKTKMLNADRFIKAIDVYFNFLDRA